MSERNCIDVPDLPGPASGQEAAPALMDIQQAFLELGRLDLTETPMTQVMHRIAELAKATVPGAEEVSVTLVEGGHARSVAFTGTLAVQLDERQYEQGFGPCMDAALHEEQVMIADTTADERYGDFGAIAARAGVRSSLSVGMPTPRRTVGGLNLYARSPGAFDEESAQLAQAFASYAAVAVANAAVLDSRAALAHQLESAITSRAVIEQAKGVLMARLGVSADEAFARLAGQSQRSNRKLREVAADVLEQARRPPGGR